MVFLALDWKLLEKIVYQKASFLNGWCQYGRIARWFQYKKVIIRWCRHGQISKTNRLFACCRSKFSPITMGDINIHGCVTKNRVKTMSVNKVFWYGFWLDASYVASQLEALIENLDLYGFWQAHVSVGYIQLNGTVYFTCTIILLCMMTSSYGNNFPVTAPLWGKSTGDRWIPSQRSVTRSLDVLFDLHLNKRFSKQ